MHVGGGGGGGEGAEVPVMLYSIIHLSSNV